MLHCLNIVNPKFEHPPLCFTWNLRFRTGRCPSHKSRERSYWDMSVEECVEQSVSTRMTQAHKQRGWGAVGSRMARLNRAGCIEPVLCKRDQCLRLFAFSSSASDDWSSFFNVSTSITSVACSTFSLNIPTALPMSSSERIFMLIGTSSPWE